MPINIIMAKIRRQAIKMPPHPLLSSLIKALSSLAISSSKISSNSSSIMFMNIFNLLLIFYDIVKFSKNILEIFNMLKEKIIIILFELKSNTLLWGLI